MHHLLSVKKNAFAWSIRTYSMKFLVIWRKFTMIAKTLFRCFFADTWFHRLSRAFCRSCKSWRQCTHGHSAGHLAAIGKSGNARLNVSLWDPVVSWCVFLGIHTIGSICVKMPAAANFGPGANPQSAFRASNTTLCFLFPYSYMQLWRQVVFFLSCRFVHLWWSCRLQWTLDDCKISCTLPGWWFSLGVWSLYSGAFIVRL